jgi:hypothetical protein
MDLLAQKRMLLVLTALVFTSVSWAGDGFYQLSRVDYFSLHLAEEKAVPAPLWDAKEEVPGVVMELLNDPSEQSARRYLDWNRERLMRVARAQAMVDAVAGEGK